MNNPSYIAIIVEGTDREPQIIQNMLSIYFKLERFKIISFPADQNIYMLWNLLQKDDFETDLIEVIREYSPCAAATLGDLTRSDFSEIYLFFDYDGHQNNLPQNSNITADNVLREMLETFDNETDLGKLYISYPMVEALRDFIPTQCTPATSCFWSLDNVGNYKHDTGVKSSYPNILHYRHPDWCAIINVFAMRLSCLFHESNVLSFEDYRRRIFPLSIYEQQAEHILRREVFVLSAFPEFLLDYFRVDFWRSIIQYANLRPGVCGYRYHSS